MDPLALGLTPNLKLSPKRRLAEGLNVLFGSPMDVSNERAFGPYEVDGSDVHDEILDVLLLASLVPRDFRLPSSDWWSIA